MAFGNQIFQMNKLRFSESYTNFFSDHMVATPIIYRVKASSQKKKMSVDPFIFRWDRCSPTQ